MSLLAPWSLALVSSMVAALHLCTQCHRSGELYRTFRQLAGNEAGTRL